MLAADLLPRRPRARQCPQITDAELICLAVAQILLDVPSERRFLRFAMCRLELRQWIESVFDTLKGQLSLEHHGSITMPGLMTRIAQRPLALAAALWHNQNTGQPGRHLTAYEH